MQTRCLASLLVLVALLAPAVGQQVWKFQTSNPPSKLGVDSKALDQAAALVADLVAQDEILGAVVLVARGRSILLHDAFGASDVSGKIAMRKDALFRMASNTKAVTAAAVLALVDQGKVKLDDPVLKWLPTWDRGDAKKVTVRHLLTHTSGLRIRSLFLYPLLKQSKQYPDAPNLVLECKRFAMVGPKAEPGSTYSYSNPGYNTLAAIVELASGVSFEQYCMECFYKPLAMADTTHHESRADLARMSVVVRGKESKQWQARWTPGDKATVPFVRGSGGLISSAIDYAKFCRMILDGGACQDDRLLSRQLVTAATKNQISHIQGVEYGFGWRIDDGGSFSHSGSDGTFVWCDPSRELIGMVLTQTQGSKKLGAVRAEFRKIVTKACLPTDMVRNALK